MWLEFYFRSMFLVVFVLFISSAVLPTNAIMFRLAPNTQKCLRDEMQGNQIVAGEYEITKAPGQKIDYVVRDTKGHILAQKEEISKGKFSFTSEVYDTFEICFVSHVPSIVPHWLECDCFPTYEFYLDSWII